MLNSPVPFPDLSADEPCGPNLEFDGDFSEFERLSIGKPEQQYGTTVVPAEEPEWKDVIAAGSALMERTYDLRVMAQLAVARLQREGAPGYAEGLALIRQMLEARWPTVHPQLDPEDDNDPTLRANALLAVAAPGRVLRYLRSMPLARSARAGAVSWRDVAVASGAIEPEPGVEKMTDAVLAAAFRETDPARLAVLQEAIASSIESAAAIPAAFNDQAGYGTGPDFTELTKLLRDINQTIERHAAPAELAADPVEEAVVPEAGASPAPRPREAVMSIAALGPVTSRADAVRLLDLVIDYYTRHEPSSPLPLLIARARRLADKGFLDLLRDLAPDGISQAERIIGEG